jgi:hypothetical protein
MKERGMGDEDELMEAFGLADEIAEASADRDKVHSLETEAEEIIQTSQAPAELLAGVTRFVKSRATN